MAISLKLITLYLELGSLPVVGPSSSSSVHNSSSLSGEWSSGASSLNLPSSILHCYTFSKALIGISWGNTLNQRNLKKQNLNLKLTIVINRRDIDLLLTPGWTGTERYIEHGNLTESNYFVPGVGFTPSRRAFLLIFCPQFFITVGRMVIRSLYAELALVDTALLYIFQSINRHILRKYT